MRQTALNARHKVSARGWSSSAAGRCPSSTRSIVEEHEVVRTKAGLFDLQHMGRLRLTGRDRVKFLEGLVTQAVGSAKPGMARYSIVTDEKGHALDDIIFYTLPECLIVIVNAGNRERIVAHMQAHL